MSLTTFLETISLNCSTYWSWVPFFICLLSWDIWHALASLPLSRRIPGSFLKGYLAWSWPDSLQNVMCSLSTLYSSSSAAVRIAVSLLQILHWEILSLQSVHHLIGETPRASPWKKSPCRGGITFVNATCLIEETAAAFFEKDPRGTTPSLNLDL